jgi:mono/diheme cytochrome c family protein/SAM-dependent methyltransferase
MTSRIASATIIAVGVVAVSFSALHAQPSRSVWDGVYTDAQATRGAALFDRECAQCHGPAGAGGGMAPALVDAAFLANYDGQTVGDLFDRNRTTMPVGREGQLSGQQNADITAFMLQFNKFPAGASELPSQSATLKMIAFVAQKQETPRQGDRPPGTHQDNTDGKEWIRRLERPERIPGLKIDDVIACLRLRPGDVVADIGAGTGAFTIPFARAVAPSGTAIAVDIWSDLLDYISAKARSAGVTNLQTVLGRRDDPALSPGQVDVAFFHDVFHNTNDREAYLRVLAAYLKPGGRIAIVEQEFDDPVAKKWDVPEDRITPDQVNNWMGHVGFRREASFDIFKGANNPRDAGMPERWFVLYTREAAAAR